MNILVTLNSGLGADTGPNFNLTADVGSVTPSTATKSELLAGKFVDVDPSATQITVTSIGVCTTSIVLNIVGQTTTTTTSAPQSYSLGYDVSDFFAACIDYGTSPSTFYSATGTSLGVGEFLYSNQSLSIVADDGYYSDGTNWWRVRFGAGYIASTGSCSTTTTTTQAPTTTTTSTSTTSTSTTSTSTSTTLAPDTFNLGYDASVGWQACYAATATYYAVSGEVLENSAFIYTDSTLSTKPADGYYSNGANYWNVIDGELFDETPCPTTSTTSTTSTSTSTTSTSTTSTSTTSTSTSTTSTSTSTSTTTAAPTSTTTSTTTQAQLSLYLASTLSDACNQINGQALTNISYTGGPAYCNFTTLNSTQIAGLSNGTYYVSDGTNVRSWTKASTPSVLFDPSVCSGCPTTTTTSTSTSTTSTAAPTSTSTSTSTSTTTAAPTSTTTSTSSTTSTTTQPGDTTTTSTTQAPCSLTIYFDVSVSPSPGGWDTQAGACAGTGTPLTVYFSNSGGCETTFNGVFTNGKALYTNSALTTLLQGNDKFFKDVSAPNTGNTIQIGNDGFIDTIGDCITTTTTTTAAPTTTTTTAAPTTTTTAAPTTTTTAAPTTTTTTAVPAWYSLYSCTNGSTQNSTQKTVGTFVVNERVTFGGAFWYVLAELSSNPGGPLIDVVTVGGAGVTGCPATTTTTTTTAAPQCTYDGLTVVCDSTTTTTAAPTTTTTAAPTTTTTSSTQLLVYAKYINSNGNLQYQINFGPIEQLGSLTTDCNYITTLAINVGDEITFSDVNSGVIATSTTVCPDGPGGFGCSAGYSVLISGTQYVYVTIDGSSIC